MRDGAASVPVTFLYICCKPGFVRTGGVQDEYSYHSKTRVVFSCFSWYVCVFAQILAVPMHSSLPQDPVMSEYLLLCSLLYFCL